jgi:putative effector of murein hydrolase LrgA (UPF0299 family)
MIQGFALLLVLQLAGEAAARALALPVPGPVVGMALALALCLLLPRADALARPSAEAIVARLGLLFVPAGVGVVGHLGRLGGEAFAIGAALVLSTAAAIAAGALAFRWTARALGDAE